MHKVSLKGLFDPPKQFPNSSAIDKVFQVSKKGIEAVHCHNGLSFSTELTECNPNKRSFAEFQAQSEEVTVTETANEFVVTDEPVTQDDVAPNDTSTVDGNSSLPLIDQSLRQNFKDFCKRDQHELTFTKAQVDAIKLLCILRQTKAPLNTYEAHMKWHLEAMGKLRANEPVTSSPEYISREKIFKMLRRRYNVNPIHRNIEKIILPHSRAQANIVWHDAKAAMVSLLTDPRITDEDYLFFGDNPCSPPPEKLNYIEDLNTGKAYLKTYKKLIDDPSKQVLLPVIFYIDGANTGQFADLPVTAVKFSLGIFTRKARDKEYCWRILGYIPAVNKFKSKGCRFMKESGHADSLLTQNNLPEDAGLEDNVSVSKAQDLHTMLRVVLRSYVELQNSGFIWDLRYIVT